jgi:hypothetical protein
MPRPIRINLSRLRPTGRRITFNLSSFGSAAYARLEEELHFIYQVSVLKEPKLDR